MMRSEVRTPEDALAYLVDCQLATVLHVIGKRSSAKCDIERHVEIGQLGVNWLLEHKISLEGTMADKIARQHNGDVAHWAETYRG